MDKLAILAALGEQAELCEKLSYLTARLGSVLHGIDEPEEALGWCPEHAFVIASMPRPQSTGLPQFSCGCPYTKARIINYREAIQIVKRRQAC